MALILLEDHFQHSTKLPVVRQSIRTDYNLKDRNIWFKSLDFFKSSFSKQFGYSHFNDKPNSPKRRKGHTLQTNTAP